ncbi:MAG: hypothetical protein IJ281_00240 [Clostridia bacterium]|nr:hypothetical protein [Clostridia bacterium]
MLITNAVILVLLNVITLYMDITETEAMFSTRESMIRSMQEFARVMRAINILVSSCLAVVWGCGCMSYLNSKTNIQFYHSIPKTRISLYISESLAKFLCYLIPMCLSVGLSVIIMGVHREWNLSVIGIQLSGLICSVIYFLLYFCIMVFAASFTGTAFARIMNAGLVVFLPSAIVLCLTYIWSYNAVYSVHTWATELALKIFLPARTLMVAVEESENVLGELILALVVGLAFWVLGLLIYRFRKSELSGTPVISKVASAVIKYACMFCGAVVGGIFFEAIAGGDGWFICGALIGALLCMMLINTILTKSAKQMFRGLPGFGAFCGVFLAVFVLFGVDLVGMDGYVPHAAGIKYITVTTGDTTFRMEDREDIENLSDAVREYIKANPTRESYRSVSAIEIIEKERIESVTHETDEMVYSYKSVSNSFCYMNIRFVTRLGFIYEKSITIYPAYTGEEGAKLLTALADAEEFADAYFDLVPSDVNVRITSVNHIRNDQMDVWNEKGYPERLRAMRAGYNGMDYFQRGTFLSLSCRGAQDDQWYPTYVYPVYDITDNEWRALVNTISYIYVMNNETGEITKYEDADSIRAICESTYFAQGSTVFTLLDSYYGVYVYFADGQPAASTGAFVRGLVPDFIP